VSVAARQVTHFLPVDSNNMKKSSTLIAIAAVCYIGLILFVQFHPLGRDINLLDFDKHPAAAVMTSIGMLATGAVILAGTKDQNGLRILRTGCLSIVLVVIAGFVAAFIDVTPDAWTPLQSQQFTRNLMDVTVWPFVPMLVYGLGRMRLESSKSRRS
jgi:hypothetical protein